MTLTAGLWTPTFTFQKYRFWARTSNCIYEAVGVPRYLRYRDGMPPMVFATASGKTIVLPPVAGKRIFWEVQDGLSAESHFSDKDAPYQNYRRRRLGAGGTGTPGTYSVAIARTAQKQLDRIGEES